MKRIMALLLALLMIASLAACQNHEKSEDTGNSMETFETADSETVRNTASSESDADEGVALADLKVGYIFTGDENDCYTAAHYAGLKEMQETLGLLDDQIIIKQAIPEDEMCYEAAGDLADQGCQIVFASSNGYEPFILRAAKEFPDVQFCQAAGEQAAGSGLDNMHNFFAAVYESRYVSGVVAGMKLSEMIASGTITEAGAKIGYVGAYPNAEVISGFTAFFLGARSQCPSATMEVRYTYSWSDFDLEKECAESLIADKFVLIGQHVNTTAVPEACEAAGVPCVGYNVSVLETAPNWALTSASINWEPYYEYAVKCILDGTVIDTDWCQGYNGGAVCITGLNESAVAEGTSGKVAETETAIKEGSLHVFDTSTWTVNGTAYTEADSDNVSDGYFHESEKASAPAFAFIIDGITAVAE